MERGKRLFTIYAEKAGKLKRAKQVLEEEEVIYVGDRREMVAYEVKKTSDVKPSNS